MEVPESIAQYIPFALNVLYAIGILIAGNVAGSWAQRLVVAAVQRKNLDQAIGRFLATIARYSVIAAAVIAALGKVGVETTSLVAIFASAGLAVGLALQGSLSNFASGVLILAFRPFDLLDVVTVAGMTGRVSEIGLFATTLVTPDHKTYVVPNSEITGGVIENLSKEGRIRGSIDVGVAYGSDANQVIEVLLGAAAKCSHAMTEPAPDVGFVGLGASSIDFQLHCFTTPDTFVPMLGQVRQQVYEDLTAAGIDIPYQTVTILRDDAA